MSQTFLNGYTEDQRTRLIHSLNATLNNGTADPLIHDVATKKLTLSNALEALAIKHVVDYAAAHGQPCVVNCSFGAQQTLTADYSLQEELMNSLTGPGRIIVCSAGNYADGILYRVKPAQTRMDDRMWLKSSLTPTITLRSAGSFMLKLLLDIEGADTLCLTSDAIVEAGSAGYQDSIAINNSAVQSKFYVESHAYSTQMTGLTAYSVRLTLPTPAKAYTKPSFAIIVESDAEVEVMGSSSAATFNRLNTSGYVNSAPYTVTVPATFTEMIAVGLTSHRDSVTNIEGNRITYEYNHNLLGQVVSWSGSGPTLEGRMKPDVVAPGHNIVSAFNSNCPLTELTTKKAQLVASTRIGEKDYYWKAESGTSMSAPVVTGTIALWLQANPELTPDDVKQILAHTARHPEADETYPNYRYGYGEIDAYRGLLYLAELTGVEGLSDYQPQKLTFRIEGRTLRLLGTAAATVSLYALGGQVVLHTQTADGTIDLSHLRPGVYAVQVDTGEASTTGSTLIRLQ